MKLYRTSFSCLYGCETWSVTQKEEHLLKVLHNGVVRKISGTEREEGAGGWTKLRNGGAL
jgi:hypothetical protein